MAGVPPPSAATKQVYPSKDKAAQAPATPAITFTSPPVSQPSMPAPATPAAVTSSSGDAHDVSEDRLEVTETMKRLETSFVPIITPKKVDDMMAQEFARVS